jgi:phage replication O-like protein O
MANPQKEEGYTAIANEIIEAIYKTRLSGHEFRMVFLIIRKTYGFNKVEDAIALSQMQKALSLSKTRCSQVINGLQLKKIVTVTENINGIGKKYKFNKNFEQWNTVTKKCNRYGKVKSTVTEKCNRPLHKSVSTKDTLTKDTLTKDKYILSSKEIVSYLNEKTQKNFSHKTKSTITYIKARLLEGRTLEDFKIVINNKCSKWLLDPNMIDYLRPSTLFGPKFESYLNERVHPLTGKVSDTTLRNIESFNAWSPPQ